MLADHRHPQVAAVLPAVLARQRKAQVAGGIGTALLGEVIARAVTAGVRTLVLNTQDDVPWNRPWYEHAGFVVVPEAQWTATMRDDTAAQVAAGLDSSTRVHMRLTLAGTDRS